MDILINNAGIITNNKTFAQQTDADINRTFDINTKGAMFLTLRFLPGMQARECGHICNITSSAGMLALPKMSLYAASKWAAIGWSESLRIELAREKSPVKVTTIAPYFINTGMFDGIHSLFKIQNPEVVARKTIWAWCTGKSERPSVRWRNGPGAAIAHLHLQAVCLYFDSCGVLLEGIPSSDTCDAVLRGLPVAQKKTGL